MRCSTEPDKINTRADKIAAVTAADVQRVAKQYLVKSSRTVVMTAPKAAPQKETSHEARDEIARPDDGGAGA
jgi:predicted Zn-dependent peptidase